MADRIFDQSFYKKLATLQFLVRSKLSQGASGGRKSIAKGTSVEFSDFREYIQGDDFRRIDWNAYGRFEKLFVKLFMEEREAVFNIYLDGSQSMDFGAHKKSTLALQLSAALGYIVMNNLDRVQVQMIQEGALNTLRVTGGKVGFQKLLKALTDYEFHGKTALHQAIRKQEIKFRGISIIISDFLTSEPIEDLLKYLAYKKQEIILIQVLAREELEPNFEQVVALVDSETQNKVKVSLTPQLRKAYKNTLDNHTKQLEGCASKYGATYVQVGSDEPLEQVVLKSFASKGFLQKL